MKPQKDHSTGNSGSSAAGHISEAVNEGLVNGYDIVLHGIFGHAPGRATADIDTAIFVHNWTQFDEIKASLIKSGLTETEMVHRLREPKNQGTQLIFCHLARSKTLKGVFSGHQNIKKPCQ